MFNEEFIFKLTDVNTKKEVFSEIAKRLKKSNIIKDEDNLISKLEEREEQSSTGFEGGIAIPHAKISDIKSPIVVVANTEVMSWPSLDNKKTDLVLCIIVPEDSGSEHLNILAKLSAKLMDNDFVAKLKEASPTDKVKMLQDIDGKATYRKTNEGSKFYVAVTGCPTGIAHTFMAAENLEKTADELGYEIKVETRGQNGIDNQLTKDDIKRADGVIITADVDVDINRFANKKVINKPVKDGVKDVKPLFDEVDEAPLLPGDNSSSSEDVNLNSKPSVYTSLMNGVTHMLPFTIAGGIFIALRFFFGTQADIDSGVQPVLEMLQVGEFFGQIGDILFAVMIPILAAYIAESIGKRPGLMIGYLAGALAVANGSGFLGAIIGGFLAGYVALWLVNITKKVPDSLRGLFTILIVPLAGALIIALFMLVFGVPIAWLNNALTSGLESLEDFSPILLGAIIGLMMAADMGGPINKAAYVTGTLLLSEGNETFMAAVMAGGMVPPLAIFVSAVIRPKMYKTSEERGAAYTNIILGASFITEGAIPFAAKDPSRVIPALMIGGAVGGALTMLFGITLPAPHGGIFVFPLVNSPLMYLIAIVAGAIVGGIMLVIFNGYKKEVK